MNLSPCVRLRARSLPKHPHLRRDMDHRSDSRQARRSLCPVRWRTRPSTEYASCCQSRIRTRSRTPTSTPNEKRSVRQTPARMPFWRQSQLHQAASSIAHSPTAEGVQPSTNRIAGKVHRRLPQRLWKPGSPWTGAAKLIKLTLYCSMARGWAICYGCSISAVLGG